MSGFNFHSHKTQLVATAIAASATTAALVSAYNIYSKRSRRRDLNADILRSIASNGSSSSLSRLAVDAPGGGHDRAGEIMASDQDIHYQEDLIKEQLARNYAFFGDDGMSNIRRGTVVVVGCGGVGSWAAVMLVRSCVLFAFSLSLMFGLHV